MQLSSDLERLRNGLNDPICESRGGAGLLANRRDEGELIAAHSSDEGSVGRSFQTSRYRAKKRVTDDMAKNVVGFLEVIKIDTQHREISPI
jgi:hypothetical protein